MFQNNSYKMEHSDINGTILYQSPDGYNIRYPHVYHKLKSLLGIRDDKIPFVFKDYPDAQELVTIATCTGDSIFIKMRQYKTSRAEIIEEIDQSETYTGSFLNSEYLTSFKLFERKIWNSSKFTIEIRITSRSTIQEKEHCKRMLYTDSDIYVLPRWLFCHNTSIHGTKNMCILDCHSSLFLMLKKKSIKDKVNQSKIEGEMIKFYENMCPGISKIEKCLDTVHNTEYIHRVYFSSEAAALQELILLSQRETYQEIKRKLEAPNGLVNMKFYSRPDSKYRSPTCIPAYVFNEDGGYHCERISNIVYLIPNPQNSSPELNRFDYERRGFPSLTPDEEVQFWSSTPEEVKALNDAALQRDKDLYYKYGDNEEAMASGINQVNESSSSSVIDINRSDGDNRERTGDRPIELDPVLYDLLSHIDFAVGMELRNEAERRNTENSSETYGEEAIKKVYKNLDIFLFKDAFRFIRESLIQEECAICWATFQPTDIVKRFSCGKHLFHKKCLKLWLQSKVICPTCKYNMMINDKKEEEGEEAKIVEFLKKKRYLD